MKKLKNIRILSKFILILTALPLSACASHSRWNDIDISGNLPPLDFKMTRANDARQVSGRDYQGKITLLYFGYTYCPDACPTTLANIGRVLRALGPQADAFRVLFVTVDPDRDSVPKLKEYAAAFAPQVDALHGTQNALTSLARRYRVAYSVKPANNEHPYEVTHSSGVYVFDRHGAARLLITSLSTGQPDLQGVEADLRRLIESGN